MVAGKSIHFCVWLLNSPGFHHIRVLTKEQIVENDVKAHVGMASIQALENGEKKVAVVGFHASALHRALVHRERRKQARRLMASVDRRLSFGFPGLRGSSG